MSNARQFWTNYMSMDCSLEDAKDNSPKAEWSDLRCYVEIQALQNIEFKYEALQSRTAKLVAALEKYETQSCSAQSLDMAAREALAEYRSQENEK